MRCVPSCAPAWPAWNRPAPNYRFSSCGLRCSLHRGLWLFGGGSFGSRLPIFHWRDSADVNHQWLSVISKAHQAKQRKSLRKARADQPAGQAGYRFSGFRTFSPGNAKTPGALWLRAFRFLPSAAQSAMPCAARSAFSFSGSVNCTAFHPARRAPSTLTGASSMKSVWPGERPKSRLCFS